MKNLLRKYGKGLALSVLIVAAGCSYSCGRYGQGEELTGVQTEGQENLRRAEEQEESRKPEEGRMLPKAEAPEESEAGNSSPEEEAAQVCFVHVCGEVENPGVYELKEGQRVFEAIAAAGGFGEQAARDYLNLAEAVWDGMKLEVPNREQVPDTERTAQIKGQGMEQGSKPSKVNLNTATREELMTLRGIGEAKAEDIIRYREEQGGFGCIEDVMKISGIKEAAFQKIKDDISV